MKNVKKTSAMKSATSMLELIAYIVVAGIIASVALPSFFSVQDDAKVSSEKSTIGSIRSSIGMLHGKAIIKNSDFKVKFTAPDSTTKILSVVVSDELYPTGLSVRGTAIAGEYTTSELASDGSTTADAFGATSSNGEHTLGLVLDFDGRTLWKTGATEAGTSGGTDAVYASGNTHCKTMLEGQASQATGVKDDIAVDEFELDSFGAWQYDCVTGTLIYRANNGAASPAALLYTSDTN